MGLFGRKSESDLSKLSMPQESGIYVIFDRVAEECGPVFSSKNDGVAMRGYREILKQTANVNSEEFQLLKLGRINMSTLEITLEVNPVHIVLPPSQGDLFTEGK